MGFGGKGFGKGKKGGKGKGKKGGKGKGKGKKGGKTTQMRREIRGVVDEVGRKYGDGNEGGDDAAPRQKKTALKPSRRVERRNKRQEQKAKRAYHFGEGRRKQQPAQQTGGDAQQSKGVARKPGMKVPAHGQPAQQVKKKRRRSHADDDDEITSEEEGGNGGQKSGKVSGKAARIEDEEAEEEDVDEDEEEEEENDQEAMKEESEEEKDEADAEDSASGSHHPKKEAASMSSSGGYVPPHLRAAGRSNRTNDSSDIADMRRQLRGMMNRVSEGNLDPSGRELIQTLEQIIPKHGAASTADALMDVLVNAAVGDANISVLVLGCYAALACVAHVLMGVSFGGAMLQQSGSLLRRRLASADASDEPTGEDARIAKNCVTLVSLLFSFGLFPGSVIFDLVRFVFSVGQASEVRVELALTILRYAGKTLRAECMEDFKGTLKYVTDAASGSQKAEETQNGSSIRTRIDFLLRELQDLKNNKVSFAVMDRFDQTRGWLESTPLLNRKKVADHQLAVSFKFLEEDPPDGWPLGAGKATLTRVRGTGATKAGAAADSLRAAAVAQRLTTEIRQSLFVALMGAEDFEHAADRVFTVSGSGKTGPSEACLVVFHCAVREKMPNPFYEHVVDTLCTRPAPWGKKFVHFCKRAAVQHLQQAHGYGLHAAVNLAELCAGLIALPSVGLPLSTIRFMKFGEAGATSGGNGLSGMLGVLLRHMAESLLRRLVDAEATVAVFEPLRKYDDVREGLLLVMDGLVKPRLPKPTKQSPPADKQVWENFRAARKELTKQSRD